MADPSGERGEYTSIGAPLSSREASRNVTSSSSPANRTVTVIPGRLPVGPWRLPDASMLQDVLELDDWPLDLALLFLGGVVAAVLAQVTLIPGGLDLLRDVYRPGPEVIQFDLSRSYASWVSQVRLSFCVSVTGTPCLRCGYEHPP